MFFWSLLAGWILTTVLLLPLLPCGLCRGAVYQERMRHAQAPQLSPAQAEAIRAYALADQCRRCFKGRKSLLRSVLD